MCGPICVSVPYCYSYLLGIVILWIASYFQIRIATYETIFAAYIFALCDQCFVLHPLLN